MVGTYGTTNSIVTVMTMAVFGGIEYVMKRVGIPAGPVVLGLLLGPLARATCAARSSSAGPGRSSRAGSPSHCSR